MVHWPDEDESLLTRYIEQLGYKDVTPHRCVLRQFEHHVRQYSPRRGLTVRVLRRWIRKRAQDTTHSFMIRQTQFAKKYLDWLVQQNVLRSHPLERLQKKYGCRSIRAI